jgi:O-acetyl-ADP-ribose deacetylase
MKIEVIKGDITKIQVDAIVNAANSRLAGGGGVDGAIHQAGGPEIMKECILIREKEGGCPPGHAVVTTAGKLPARKVIHAVGPIWQGGNHREKEILANAYENCLKAAVQHGLKSLAFPNISTGIYGYPKYDAAATALMTVRSFPDHHKQIDKVIFVCFDEESFTIYSNLIKNE